MQLKFFRNIFRSIVCITMSKSSRTTSADVLNIRFNQDSSNENEVFFHTANDFHRSISACFSCASSDGIRVFNVEPLKQKLFLGKTTRCFFFLQNKFDVSFRCWTSDVRRNALSFESDRLRSCGSRHGTAIECWQEILRQYFIR